MNKRGFTLIELLIVGGVIGIIGMLAAVSVLSARAKQRDATRISNVRQMQVVLESFYTQHNMYPVGDQLPLGDATQSLCLGSEGFAADCSGADAVYLRLIPSTLEKGLEGLAVCGTPTRNAFCYTQLREGEAYAIQFELESNLRQAGLVEGLNCVTPEDIVPGACEVPVVETE